MEVMATAEECAYSKSMKPKHLDAPVARCRISCKGEMSVQTPARVPRHGPIDQQLQAIPLTSY